MWIFVIRFFMCFACCWHPACKVEFYVIGRGDCLNSDVCVPGWACKTVTRADQAFFTQKTRQFKAILYAKDKDAKTVNSFENLELDLLDCLPVDHVGGGRLHSIIDLDLRFISSLENDFVKEGLMKDVASKKEKIEKTTKALISSCHKKRANETKKKARDEVAEKRKAKKRGGAGAVAAAAAIDDLDAASNSTWPCFHCKTPTNSSIISFIMVCSNVHYCRTRP